MRLPSLLVLVAGSIVLAIPAIPPYPTITPTALQASADNGSCPGYAASNIVKTDSSLTADLTLAGTACNIYSDDLQDLKLLVEYQTGKFQVPVVDLRETGFFLSNPLLYPRNILTELQISDSMSKSTMPVSMFSRCRSQSSLAQNLEAHRPALLSNSISWRSLSPSR
jgi:hypothetical protein